MESVGGAGSWASLLKANCSAVDTILDLVSTSTVDGVSEVPADLIEDGIEDWNKYLVGFFIGKGLPFNLVLKALELTWKGRSGFSLSANRDFLYIKFDDVRDRTHVMEAGPFHIAGKLFILRPWSELLLEQRKNVETLPIWIKVWDLPKELWSKKGLSFIASLLGSPICADEKTIKRERLDFARICVEIPASFQFKSSLKLRMKRGRIAVLKIQYPWKPAACSKCSRFGHKVNSCDAIISRVWQSNLNCRKVPSEILEEDVGNINVTVDGGEVDADLLNVAATEDRDRSSNGGVAGGCNNEQVREGNKDCCGIGVAVSNPFEILQLEGEDQYLSVPIVESNSTAHRVCREEERQVIESEKVLLTLEQRTRPFSEGTGGEPVNQLKPVAFTGTKPSSLSTSMVMVPQLSISNGGILSELQRQDPFDSEFEKSRAEADREIMMVHARMNEINKNPIGPTLRSATKVQTHRVRTKTRT